MKRLEKKYNHVELSTMGYLLEIIIEWSHKTASEGLHCPFRDTEINIEYNKRYGWRPKLTLEETRKYCDQILDTMGLITKYQFKDNRCYELTSIRQNQPLIQ